MRPCRRALPVGVALAAFGVTVAAGCDPGYDVDGTISLAPTVEPSAFLTLNVVLQTNPADRTLGETRPLRDVRRFPYRFHLGTIGSIDAAEAVVLAFLSHAPKPAAPAAGDPTGTMAVKFQGCTGGGYCGTAAGVEVLIEP